MKEEISIKKISYNLKRNKKFIEIEIPGDEILQTVAADSPEFEKQVKQKIVEYMQSA